MKTVLFLVAVVAIATALVFPEQRASAFDCFLCRLAVKTADPFVDEEFHIAEDKFLAECKKELKGIPFLEQTCLNFAHSEFGPIIMELESGTAPEDVCRAIEQC
ncbi:Saposin B-type domain-containing protein [Caenorhabditis elegans]|uniref:Saposin B-type domain-containing protein n=1 Tax=Caenorhabditis elegans TaxID=6239 RepID=Q52GZ2_CAEEL|nr:Saposin B-type domain-containing protein [Caenorhabditis elegans]CAI91169.1 Saposin B-type domain-containing protein [Caenorhabditis elegans]|eukprot:NP_001024927.1 SaPosin-like Protein family [Caenorhabditis elegans]